MTRLVRLLLVPLLALAPAPAVATHALPDLSGGAFPTTDAPGEPARIYAWIENWPTGDGETDAGPFDVEILVDGALFDAFRVDGLPAFDLHEYLSNGSVAFPEGEHTFQLRIDVRDEVAESNEANEFTDVTRFGLEHPDLALEIVALRSEGPLEDRTLHVDWRVCNQGDLGSQVPVHLVGHVRSTERVSPLYPGVADRNLDELLDVIEPGDCLEGTVSAPTGPVGGRRDVRLFAARQGGSAWEPELQNNEASAQVLVLPTGVIRL